jgi:hypothetical protein
VSQRLTIAAAVAVAAASLSLYPLVSGWLWFWEGAGAVAVIALAGALTRLRVVPWLLGAAAGLAVLLLYLNLLFASAQSLGRLIPTATSLRHLWRLARFGLDETARFAPPAPAGHGILLLTVAGIGVVAVATDLLAVRLRRPAVAGLPLLVLFCVPLTTSLHQGVFGAMTVFGLGMAGYLGMLAVDARDRLRLWGRLVTVWHRGQDSAVAQRGTPNTKELAAAGRRIGVAAVVIALFVPLLVPGLRDHKLFSGGGGGSEELVTLPDPLVQMNIELQRKNPAHVLTYRTADPDPQYLQVYVLSNLTSSTWTRGPPRGPARTRREAADHAGIEPGHHHLVRAHQDHSGQGADHGGRQGQLPAAALPGPDGPRERGVAHRPAHAHHVLGAGPLRTQLHGDQPRGLPQRAAARAGGRGPEQHR